MGTEPLSNPMSTLGRWRVRPVCDKRDVSLANWKTTLLLPSSTPGESSSLSSCLQTPMLQACGERAFRQKQPGHHNPMTPSVNTSPLSSCPFYLSFLSLISSFFFSFPHFLSFRSSSPSFSFKLFSLFTSLSVLIVFSTLFYFNFLDHKWNSHFHKTFELFTFCHFTSSLIIFSSFVRQLFVQSFYDSKSSNECYNSTFSCH